MYSLPATWAQPTLGDSQGTCHLQRIVTPSQHHTNHNAQFTEHLLSTLCAPHPATTWCRNWGTVVRDGGTLPAWRSLPACAAPLMCELCSSQADSSSAGEGRVSTGLHDQRVPGQGQELRQAHARRLQHQPQWGPLPRHRHPAAGIAGGCSHSRRWGRVMQPLQMLKLQCRRSPGCCHCVGSC